MRLTFEIVETLYPLRFEFACLRSYCPILRRFEGVDASHTDFLNDYINNTVPDGQKLAPYSLFSAIFNLTCMLSACSAYDGTTITHIRAPYSYHQVGDEMIPYIPVEVYGVDVNLGRHPAFVEDDSDDQVEDRPFKFNPEAAPFQPSAAPAPLAPVVAPPSNMEELVAGMKTLHVETFGTGDSGVVVDDGIEDGEIVEGGDAQESGAAALRYEDPPCAIEYDEEKAEFVTDSKNVDVSVGQNGAVILTKKDYVDPSTSSKECGLDEDMLRRATIEELKEIADCYRKHIEILNRMKLGESVDGDIVANNQSTSKDITSENGAESGRLICENLHDMNSELSPKKCWCPQLTGTYKVGRYSGVWSDVKNVAVYRANANAPKIRAKKISSMKSLFAPGIGYVPLIAILSCDRVLIDTQRVFNRTPDTAPSSFCAFPGTGSLEAIHFTQMELDDNMKVGYVKITEGQIGSIFKWIDENVEIKDLFMKWDNGAMYVRASGRRFSKAPRIKGVKRRTACDDVGGRVISPNSMITSRNGVQSKSCRYD